MNEKYQSLQKSIDQLKYLFKQDVTFLPVAKKETIRDFEEKFKLQLPEELKWYLLNVANGIVGKGNYGIDIIEKIDFEKLTTEQNLSTNPAKPFKLTTKVVFPDYDEEEDEEDRYPYEKSYLDEMDYDSFMHGYLRIADYSRIIINGKEYGNIWIDNFDNYEFYPDYNLKENKKRLKFQEWLASRILHKITLQIDWLNSQQNELAYEAMSKKKYDRRSLVEKKHAKEMRKKRILSILTWGLGIALLLHFLMQLFK